MTVYQDINRDYLHIKQAVKEAGAIALQYFGASPDSETKDDGSPVSEADIAVDRFLREKLLAGREGYGWLSEESADEADRMEKSRIWVVDPIDGTRSFLRHAPEWTISAALVYEGRPVLAVVYNPATEEFFEAMEGQGARLNGEAVRVSGAASHEEFGVLATMKVSDQLMEISGLTFRREKRVSSLAYRLCLLSAGKTDVVLFKPGSCDWDIAAADLIVREAGGLLTTFDAVPLKFNKVSVKHNSLLATNGVLHEELCKVCEKLDF